MKRNLITLAAALALATAAHAGNNNGPTFGGTQNYTTTNNTTNAPVANGGVGHGGDASAVGVGTGIGHGVPASFMAAQADVAQAQYTDPSIRRRLGLPPL